MRRMYAWVTLILFTVLLGAPAHAQQTNTLPITGVQPEAPEPVQNLSNKVLGLAMYALIALGLLGILIGGAKFAIGAPDAGKWIVRGAVALVIGAGFWAIISWLL